jgi:hypothetical protein
MNNKSKTDVPKHGPPERTSVYKESTALEAKCWAEHLSRFPEVLKKQTSDVELEEARRRGCYRVLPPVAAPDVKEATMSELLQEIDEQVKKAFILY